MARSISFDIAAADKASKALEQVAREVTELERKLDGAGGTIEIDADTTQAREKLAAVDSQLARLNAKRLKVDADIAAAQRDLQVLEAEAKRATGDRKVKVDADIAAAQAKLRALEGTRVSVDVETAAAQAKLRAIEASLSKVDGDRATAKVDVDAAGAVGGLAKIGQQLRDISSPVKIAVGIQGGVQVLAWISQVAAGLSALGAAGIGAGAVTGLALRGIGDAFTEVGQKSTSAGGAVSSNAHEMERAIEGVARAQRAHRDAVEAVGDAEYEAARAADGITRAQEGVARAEQRAADAERDLADAQKDATRVQEALNDARQDAIRALEDYASRSKNMALDQRDAANAVSQAEERLAEVRKDSKSDANDIEAAEISLARARQRQNDLQVESRRLAEDRAAAELKGVDGSDQVRAALDRQEQAARRVESANRGVGEAQRGIRDATDQVEQAQRAYQKALAGVEDAQQAVKDSAFAIKEAQWAVQEASKAAGSAGAGGADKTREAFEKLTPEGKKFVLFLRELVDGPLKDLQDTAQSGVLPGLQSGIQGFMSELGGAQVYVANIAREVGDFFDAVGPAAGRVAEALLRLGSIGAEESFDDLADGVTNVLDRFADWANSKSPQEISDDLHQIATDVKSLWDKATLAFDGIQAAWDVLNFPTSLLTAPFRSLIDLMSGGSWQEAIAEPVEGLRDVYNSVRDLAEKIPGLKGKLPELSAEFDNLDGATRGADSSTRDLEASSRDLAEAQRDVEGAVRDAKDQLLRGEEASLRYEEALSRARDTVRENGRAWETSTEKGKDNRQAMLNLIRASNDYITSLQNQGTDVGKVRSEYETQRQKLIQVATQMTGNRTTAQQYIDKLLQIPASRTTKVNADTTAAMSNLVALQNKLASLNGVLTVTPSTGTAGKGLGVYRSSGGWVGEAVSASTPFGGGPRGRDTVPGWLDPREFVVKASAAEQWGPLLELINRGASPDEVSGVLASYSGGGPAPVATPGASGARELHVHVNVTNALIGSNDELARTVVTVLEESAARGQLRNVLAVAGR